MVLQATLPKLLPVQVRIAGPVASVVGGLQGVGVDASAFVAPSVSVGVKPDYSRAPVSVCGRAHVGESDEDGRVQVPSGHGVVGPGYWREIRRWEAVSSDVCRPF
jgi:hypothetical protein